MRFRCGPYESRPIFCLLFTRPRFEFAAIENKQLSIVISMLFNMWLFGVSVRNNRNMNIGRFIDRFMNAAVSCLIVKYLHWQHPCLFSPPNEPPNAWLFIIIRTIQVFLVLAMPFFFFVLIFIFHRFEDISCISLERRPCLHNPRSAQGNVAVLQTSSRRKKKFDHVSTHTRSINL